MARSFHDILAMIDRHIVVSERNIKEQRHRVQLTERSGSDATLSRSILENLEDSLRLHYEHREIVLRDQQCLG